jgi:hypothetical protein
VPLQFGRSRSISLLLGFLVFALNESLINGICGIGFVEIAFMLLAYGGLDLLERLVSGFELVMGIIQCFGRVYHFRFKGGSKLEQLPQYIARV